MTLAILLIIVALANFLIGAMVFGRRYKHPLHQSFLLMTIGVGFWSLAIAFYLITPDDGRALFYANLYYVSALVIAVSLFSFAYSLRSNNTTAVSGPVIAALFVPFIYGIASIFNPNILLTINHHPFDISLNPLIYALYSLTFCFLFGFAAYLLVRQSMKASGRRRNQLIVVCLGVLGAGAFGILFNLILPAFDNYNFIWVGPLFSIVFLISTSFAVVRYRLFDLRLALARALAYLITLFWVIIIYALALFLVGLTLFGQSTVSTLQNLVYLGLAVLLTFTFQPLKGFFDKFSNQLFFKQPFESEKVIQKFGDVILAEVELRPLAHNVLKIIDETFRPGIAMLWVENPFTKTHEIISTSRNTPVSKTLEQVIEQIKTIPNAPIIDSDDLDSELGARFSARLERMKIGMIVPIYTTNRTIGYLVVGQRRSGGSYSSQDRYVLTTVADELALAIENSLQIQQITDFNKTLQLNIEEATKELRHTNKKLSELDESKDEFISMASHQLRTPLTTVKGYISMLLDGDVGEITPQQRKVLEEAFSSSQRMVYLIGDFLNVSRLQTGKFELESHEFDLAEVVEQEVRQMEDSARARKMKLNYQRPSGTMPISLDENKIRQVIMNFLDNAIFYSVQGDTIQVILAKHASHISLKVVDHGIGVPQSERHRLFSKFYRASNAKKQRPDGTGIGLFMARKVIVAHGGSIIFETSEGKGSTFGFRLPVKKSD